MEKVCVIGAGSTKYGKLDDSLADITVQASASAIESAGIDPKEIQAGYISNVFGVADKQVHQIHWRYGQLHCVHFIFVARNFAFCKSGEEARQQWIKRCSNIECKSNSKS